MKSITQHVEGNHCEEGWREYGGKCFVVILTANDNVTRVGEVKRGINGTDEDLGLTWEEARSFCRSLGHGAELASIHSFEENGKIVYVLNICTEF
jgi:hypothetical protein